MNSVEISIYEAMLEILKSKESFNISSVSRMANVSRQAIYRVIEKRTFQDLDKYRNKPLIILAKCDDC